MGGSASLNDIAQAYLFLMQEGFSTGRLLWSMVEQSWFRGVLRSSSASQQFREEEQNLWQEHIITGASGA